MFWGPYNKDPTIYGTILGFPILGNPQVLGGAGDLVSRVISRVISTLNGGTPIINDLLSPLPLQAEAYKPPRPEPREMGVPENRGP